MHRVKFLLILSLVYLLARRPAEALQPAALLVSPHAKYLILMIGDGMGANAIQAAERYTGKPAVYESWPEYWVSTYPYGGSYAPGQAWTNFGYVKNGTTDSSAAATALYSGVKTTNGRLSVTANGQRLLTLGDEARQQGLAVGAVTSVPISHATPGAWYAHNTGRDNGLAIADEGLWGDPNTTGNPLIDIHYSGGTGLTYPPVDVLIGAGHPNWYTGGFVNQAIRDKLAADSGSAGAFTFVERLAGHADGGARLLQAAALPGVRRLAGLFGGAGGNLEYATASGSNQNPEEPTLEQMTQAALLVLSRHTHGFILMVEGGAIDWAASDNRMDDLIGEMKDFNASVQAVVNWVDDPANDATWDNTLVMVTADHETGYLTAGPGIFPNIPLGAVNDATLLKEKSLSGTSRRAAWEDANANDLIDPGEPVYWAWNSGSHTNSLVPLFARGAGASLLPTLAAGRDPVRGAYLDNTNVFQVMEAAALRSYYFLPQISQLP